MHWKLNSKNELMPSRAGIEVESDGCVWRFVAVQASTRADARNGVVRGACATAATTVKLLVVYGVGTATVLVASRGKFV